MRELPLVISCEHGGNEVPGEFQNLFSGQRELLASHRGFDPGAADLAQWLSSALSCPCLVALTTRLVVDLNRSEGHRQQFSELTRSLPSAVKKRISNTCYVPYRARAEAIIRGVQDKLGQAIHVSVHTFVPELDGIVRNADIGILYDPKRSQEKKLADAWTEALRSRLPALRVRRNYPYRGTADGFVVDLRKRLGSRYVGIELEVKQDWPLKRRQDMPELRRAIADGLQSALTQVME